MPGGISDETRAALEQLAGQHDRLADQQRELMKSARLNRRRLPTREHQIRMVAHELAAKMARERGASREGQPG